MLIIGDEIQILREEVHIYGAVQRIFGVNPLMYRGKPHIGATIKLDAMCETLQIHDHVIS